MAAKPHSTVTDGTSISGGEKFLAFDPNESSGTRSRGFLATTIRAWIEATTTVLLKGISALESGSSKGSAFKAFNFIGASVTDAGGGQANVTVTGGGGGGTFDPPWTGAVPRALDVRGQDWCSIADFGVSDGDDVTTELRNAMSNGAREIVFPKGTWKLANINLSDYSAGFVFRGAGMWQTVLRLPAGAGDSDQMFYSSTSTGGLHLWENMQFLLSGEPNTTPDATAINLDRNTGSKVSQCYFASGTGRSAGDRKGIGVIFRDTPGGGSYNNMIDNCIFQRLRIAVLNESNLQQVIGADITVCDYGIDNSFGGDALQVFGGRSEGCIIGVIEGGKNSSYFMFRTEAHTTADYSFNAGAIDCSIFGGLTATTPTALLNPQNCTGLHIVANDLGGVTFRSDSLSRPSLFYGPNVLAPSGATGLTSNPPGVGSHAALIQQGRLVIDNDQWQVWRNTAGTGVVFALQVDSNDHVYLAPSSTARIAGAGTALGFHGVSPVTLETVTGSRASGAAFADLLTKLASKGIIVDGSSA